MRKPERQEDDELMYEETNERLRDNEYAYVYEELNIPPGTSTSLAKSDKEVNFFPQSHQSLPDIPLPVAPPTGGNVGVAREDEEESDYY